jgi:hypothetical protein
VTFTPFVVTTCATMSMGRRPRASTWQYTDPSGSGTRDVVRRVTVPASATPAPNTAIIAPRIPAVIVVRIVVLLVRRASCPALTT